MTSKCASSIKRTIVRFVILASAGIILSACATVTPRLTAQAPCATTATMVCEPFGSQSRCRCADAAAVERQMAGRDHNAAIARGW